MNILGISTFNNFKASQINRCAAMPAFGRNKNKIEPHNDIFIKSKPVNEKEQDLNDDKFKSKFTIESYEKLSSIEKQAFRKEVVRNHMIPDIRDNIAIATALKAKYDLEYGEGNWTFVSVGTSPAPIARVFEFSGVETKYLPISELRLDNWKGYKSLIKQQKKGVKAYANFLKDQKLSPKDIENSDKTYLFCDYTCYGTSFKNFQNMLATFFGISDRKQNNVKFNILNDELKSIDFNETYINHYIEHFLANSMAEYYGGIPHLECGSLGDIKEVIKNNKNSGKIPTLYNFAVMEALKKHEIEIFPNHPYSLPDYAPYLKNNPENRSSL